MDIRLELRGYTYPGFITRLGAGARTDMCAYGLRVAEGLNKKPTQWVTNCKEIALELQRRCSQDHEHEPLMGGKAEKAAVYPPRLCRAVIRGLRKYMAKRAEVEVPTEWQEVFAGEIEDGEGVPVPEESEDDLEEALDREVEEAGRPVVGQQRALEAEVTAADRVKIQLLHVNLGHPDKASFLRFLRAGRVRSEVIKWVREELECATCNSRPMPKAPRPAVVPRCYAPSVAVGIDLFFIPDVNNHRSVPVMNVVDLGTNYQMVEVLDSKDPLHIWRSFWRTWVRTFGLPQYVAMDEGREFRGGFAKLCSSAGIMMFRAAARAPWQQGRVERHGGLIKEMIEKSRGEMPPTTHAELVHLVQACECAKNRYSNRSGFSPVQRQIGQWPRVPSCLLSDEESDPSLQARGGAADEFEKLIEMRRIAQSAFMKL